MIRVPHKKANTPFFSKAQLVSSNDHDEKDEDDEKDDDQEEEEQNSSQTSVTFEETSHHSSQNSGTSFSINDDSRQILEQLKKDWPATLKKLKQSDMVTFKNFTMKQMFDFVMKEMTFDDAQDENFVTTTRNLVSRLKTDFNFGNSKDSCVLGSGAFGTVIKAEHNIDHKTYAIKLVKLSKLKENKRKEAMKEAKKLSSIDHHPQVVRYYSVWKEPLIDEIEELFVERESDGSQSTNDETTNNNQSSLNDDEVLCIQMEYCSSSLKTEIAKNLRRGHAWKYLIQILEGLAFLSEFSIVHSDLKPDNILIHEGEVKLGDFGLSYSYDESHKIGSSRGTQFYVPEKEPREKNLKVDVFSLGVVFFEMLSCFTTESERRVKLKSLIANPHSELSTCDHLFNVEKELIAKMLDSNKDSRPTAKELLMSLTTLTFKCPKCTSSKPMYGVAPWITHLTGNTHDPLPTLLKGLLSEPNHENSVQQLNEMCQKLKGQMAFSEQTDSHGKFSLTVVVTFGKFTKRISIASVTAKSLFFKTKKDAKEHACRQAVEQIMQQLRIVNNQL